MSRATTPARAARRHRARVSFWLGRAVVEVLKLGGTADELRALTAVAQRLKLRAVAGLEAGPATTASPPRR
jgi:hypothetical protein